MYGCCPSSSVCNAVGGCDPGPSSSQPSPPQSSAQCGQTSTITFVTTVTVTFTTSTCLVQPGSSHSTSVSSGEGGSGTSPGSGTVTLPSVSSPTTITTDGRTFTDVPSSSHSRTQATGPLISTLPDGKTIVSSSGEIIIGTDTIPVPTGLTRPTVITTDGETITFWPSSSGTASGSGGGGGGGGPLSTYTSWPAGASIIPVPISIETPVPIDGGYAEPCKLWFFSVSSFPWPPPLVGCQLTVCPTSSVCQPQVLPLGVGFGRYRLVSTRRESLNQEVCGLI